MRPMSFALALLATLGLATPVHAQLDFSSLDLRPGDPIYVTQPSGVEIGGRLTRISPMLLEINGYQFKPEPGLKIERRGDSLLNGTLIGLAVGALAGATIGAEGCLHSPLWPCVIGGGATWAAIGAFIDWRRVGRTRIYLGTAGPSALSLVSRR